MCTPKSVDMLPIRQLGGLLARWVHTLENWRSAMAVDKRLSKPSLNISIPPLQREAFFQALVDLRLEEEDPVMSASAIIVKTVIRQAAERRARQAPQRVRGDDD